MEWIGGITGTLFFMEVVVLDKGFYPIILHEPIIFFHSFEQRYNRLPTVGVADSGYGSEENYRFMQDNGIEAFVKYN